MTPLKRVHPPHQYTARISEDDRAVLMFVLEKVRALAIIDPVMNGWEVDPTEVRELAALSV